MTETTTQRARLGRARAAVRAFAGAALRAAAGGLSDAIGWLGLALLGRGLWLAFGEAWALMGIGAILLLVSLAAAVRGDG